MLIFEELLKDIEMLTKLKEVELASIDGVELDVKLKINDVV